jgi:hypothetical protein
MLNSDVCWTTCEMDVTYDLLCWNTMILTCILVGLKSLMISLDYRSYMDKWEFDYFSDYFCTYALIIWTVAWQPSMSTCLQKHLWLPHKHRWPRLQKHLGPEPPTLSISFVPCSPARRHCSTRPCFPRACPYPLSPHLIRHCRRR